MKNHIKILNSTKNHTLIIYFNKMPNRAINLENYEMVTKFEKYQSC